ncbi:LysR family transcriptional regulator [Serratia sp. SCBI]|nr:LysR family transcriptional regulator [Serratia sp. SCBI]
MNNLRRLDLNLLVTLDALLAEHNVTRAAQRLNFSQPAVSVHLAKLRAIFDDPLLLPGPRGMRPTARAEQLREPLRQALAALELAVTPATPFDPAVATDTWRAAAFDYGESTIVLPALNGLRTAAPGTRLAVLETAPSRIAKLAEQGEIDLAFHTREGAPPGLRQRTLFSERYVLVGRIGHPKLHENLTLAQFCRLEQVMVSPDGGGFYGITDRALADVGLTRRVVLSVPHFLFVISVLTQSDLVAMLPERLVRNQPLLQQLEPPLAVPGF